MIELFIIIFGPLLVALVDVLKILGESLLIVLDGWNQFITFITNLIFKER